MLGQAVQPASAPGIFVVIERFLDDRAVAQAAARIGHQERWVHALGSAQARAGAARAGRIVEGKVAVVQRRGEQVVLGAAEILPKAFQRACERPSG